MARLSKRDIDTLSTVLMACLIALVLWLGWWVLWGAGIFTVLGVLIWWFAPRPGNYPLPSTVLAWARLYDEELIKSYLAKDPPEHVMPKATVWVQRYGKARRRWDLDGQRAALQSIANMMTGTGEPAPPVQTRDAFKAFMTRFAREDPLYQENLQRLLAVIREEPGVLQSDLTKGLDRSSADLLRYVLYFASEIGDVQRIKKGRSYLLYPAGVVQS